MIYKKTKSSKLYLDHGLSEEEVERVHFTWREERYEQEYLTMTWREFLKTIGLSFERDRLPNWKIENKEKWLWAKLRHAL
jgi:hypothetical protein